VSLAHRLDDPTDEPSPVRPYIVARAPVRERAGPDVAWLRPYLLTGGRARPLDEVEIEAQVMTTSLGQEAIERNRFERRAVLALCQRPVAVAEVAAQLGLHLSATRVLVGDLVALGLLTVRRPHQQPQHNLEIVERVIRGLQAIA
jgi:Protein of unknown function (DUF742)